MCPFNWRELPTLVFASNRFMYKSSTSKVMWLSRRRRAVCWILGVV